MYLGQIVETGPARELLDSPYHPYTRALISAVPAVGSARSSGRARIILTGEMPSASDPPSGCRFRTRCWQAQDICAVEAPPLSVPGGGTHAAACHFPAAAPAPESGPGHPAGPP